MRRRVFASFGPKPLQAVEGSVATVSSSKVIMDSSKQATLSVGDDNVGAVSPSSRTSEPETPEPSLPSPSDGVEPTLAGTTGTASSIVGAVPLVNDGGHEATPSDLHGPMATSPAREDFGLPESAQQHNPTKPGEAKEAASPSRPAPNRKKWWFAGLGAVVVVVIVIVLGAVLGGGAPPDVPVTGQFADFSTGVSLVTEYHVDCRVRNRLAQTTIKLEVANGMVRHHEFV